MCHIAQLCNIFIIVFCMTCLLDFSSELIVEFTFFNLTHVGKEGRSVLTMCSPLYLVDSTLRYLWHLTFPCYLHPSGKRKTFRGY
jgi:hypothetical protein